MKTIIENDEKQCRKLPSGAGKPLINYLFMFHTRTNVDNNRLSIFVVAEPDGSWEVEIEFVRNVKINPSEKSARATTNFHQRKFSHSMRNLWRNWRTVPAYNFILIGLFTQVKEERIQLQKAGEKSWNIEKCFRLHFPCTKREPAEFEAKRMTIIYNLLARNASR